MTNMPMKLVLENNLTTSGAAPIVLIILLVSAIIFNLGPSPSVAEQVPNNATRNISHIEPLQIAYLTDGLFSDAGWGAFGYNAGQALMTRYDHIVTFQDNVSIPDIELTLRDYAKGNYDIIIAQGYEWGQPVLEVAKDHPDKKFIVFTGLVKSENVASIFPRQHEASFILGALASMLSKSHIIGFIGGDEKYPNLKTLYEGYRQGALYMNANTTVLETYISEWDNESKGKSAALSQIEKGADYLFHVADTSGHGVIQAAKEKGVYAFGAVSDQNKLSPETVVTSFVIDPEKAYNEVFELIAAQNFTGMIFTPGLESSKNATNEKGIVYVAPLHGFQNKIPVDIQTKLSQLILDLINKKIPLLN